MINDNDYLSTRKPLYIYMSFRASLLITARLYHDTSVEKLFSQLISFYNGLVQAEATSRTRAERLAHLDLAIILHGVEAPYCHPRTIPVTWCLSGGSCQAP